MPRWRWWHHCNPPRDYAAHAEEIIARFGLVEERDRIDVLYGVGPAVQITITGECDELGRFARIAEELVTAEGSHVQGASPTEVWFTPMEKEALVGRSAQA